MQLCPCFTEDPEVDADGDEEGHAHRDQHHEQGVLELKKKYSLCSIRLKKRCMQTMQTLHPFRKEYRNQLRATVKHSFTRTKNQAGQCHFSRTKLQDVTLSQFTLFSCHEEATGEILFANVSLRLFYEQKL